MKHTYTPYTIEEMKKDSSLPEKVKARIQHLVDVNVVRIYAAKEGETFVAYAGAGPALSYNAVLQIAVAGCGWVAVEEQNRPKDMLAKVAEILSRYKETLKKY